MKNYEETYLSLKAKFYDLTKIDTASGSVIDMMFKSISYMIQEVLNVIEKNKKPYLFTRQTGDELDSTGYFLQCARMIDETDDNYRYRLMQWTKRNASNNEEAIEEAIRTLSFSSSAKYVKYTDGVGTATVYLTPYKYEEDYIKNAINEAEVVIGKVISPATIVKYEVPKKALIKIVAYLDTQEGKDSAYIKNIATNKIKDYINNIAPGGRLMLGYINNMILDIEGVEYFNVVQVYIDDKESTEFEILQKVSSKMLYDEIIWWEVEK